MFIIRCDFSILLSTKGDVLPMPAGVSLTALVPHFTEGLANLRRFVYRGSLPTPPCYESVTWVVFNRPIALNGETVSLTILTFMKENLSNITSTRRDQKRSKSYIEIESMLTPKLIVSSQSEQLSDNYSSVQLLTR